MHEYGWEKSGKQKMRKNVQYGDFYSGVSLNFKVLQDRKSTGPCWSKLD